MDLLSIFPFFSFPFLTLTLAARVIYLKKKGIRVTRKTRNNARYLVFLYPVFGLLLLLWLTELINLAFGPTEFLLPEWFTQNLSSSVALKISGGVVVSFSLILWVLTLLHFKDSLRFGLSDHNQGKLVTSGIFSFSRNPFFLSVDLYFLGLALLHSSLFFILMAVLTLFSIHFFILKEEKFLQKHYGETYRNYFGKVRRYL
jgi:protein-S-isoprenylcysteine O-methyltransferase Ste14